MMTKKLSMLSLLLAVGATAWAQQQTFTTSGSFTVPAGVTSIQVEVVGPGGNGGGNGGGGGGGGGYASGTFAVTPAQVLNVTVGAGGSGTATSVSSLNIQATAGGNGTFVANPNLGGGGAGGVGTGGSMNHTGGTGGGGYWTYFGGGGGGAAGPNGNGTNGGNTITWTGLCQTPGGTGGASGGAPGGAGGKGAGFTDLNCNVTDAAVAGSNYGGGGGGGNGNGGPAANGAGGYCKISWCTAPAAPTGNATQTACAGDTLGSLSVTGSDIKWYAAATGGNPLPANTVLVNGQNYYASQSVGGCESATRLQVSVTVVVVNVATSVNQSTITAQANGATYQWINCGAGNTPIAGAIGKTYTPVQSGMYAVAVTQNGCTDTSACVAVNGTSVAGLSYAADEVILYPNPASHRLQVSAPQYMSGTAYTILDAVGRRYQSGSLAEGETVIDLRSMAPGVYLFKMEGQPARTFTVKP